ncbi:MAG: alkaline phosphatase D family protein [Cyclobacteriaceae bacterium]
MKKKFLEIAFILLCILVYQVEVSAQTEFVWSGAVTSNSAKVTTKVINKDANQKVKVYYSKSKSLKNAVVSDEYVTNAAQFNYISIPLSDLEENTRYYYRFSIDGKIDDRPEATGTFKTFRSEPFSFKFVVSSCAKSNKTYPAFLIIPKEKPLFFMYTGDFHYGNVDSACEESANHFFSSALRFRNVTHKQMPVAYIWDDHDYGPNNSDATAPCKYEAIQAFKTFVPHYPLPFDSKSDPVSQSFVVGNVRFILPDLRSQKIKPIFKDSVKLSAGTNFGTNAKDSTHLNWFFSELLEAKKSNQYPVFVSGIPWIGHEGGPNYEFNEDDNWSGFPEERKLIAEFLEKHQIDILIIAGDAHMVAIDDGTNSNYADEGKLKIPVFQASSLGGKKGSYKGGPYSHGYKTTPAKVDNLDFGQYGVVTVKQKKDGILITFIGKDQDGKVLRNMEGDRLKFTYFAPL